MKRFFFAAIMLVILSACGSGQNNYRYYPGYSMSGIYKSCASVSTGYAMTLLTFSGATFTTSTTVYADQGCAGALVSSSNGSGNYSTAGNQINYNFTDGAIVFDIYRLADHILLVGDRSGTNNGTSAALRPTAYSSAMIFYEVYNEGSTHHDYYREGEYAY